MQAHSDDAALPERFHPRVAADFTIKVLRNGKAWASQARNLSMAGVQLLGRPGRVGDQITLALPLPDDREVVTRARVIRSDDEATAVEFDPLDWEDLFALARFLHPRLP